MRSLFFSRLVLGSIMLAQVLLAAVACAAPDIGKVITYTSGATVLRGGKTEALALHAGIRASDTVQTDANGRVKILFNDDSSVSLGPNTTMDMNEYADMGDKPSFSIRVPQGMVRAITGKITEQNPDGFKMSSPEATVGIRGTIVTMHVHKVQEGQGQTTVYVENTLRRVYANGENIPSGNKWIHSGGSSRQERMTPEDRRYIGKELAFRGGSGSAAAAPEAGTRGRRTSTAQLASAGGSIIPQASTLNDDAQTRQTLLKTTALQQVPAMGHVSGSLYSVGSSGSFGFDMKLSSGEITNGTINLSSPSIGVFGGFSANLSGGTGLADATGFKREGANEALFHSNFKLLLNSP